MLTVILRALLSAVCLVILLQNPCESPARAAFAQETDKRPRSVPTLGNERGDLYGDTFGKHTGERPHIRNWVMRIEFSPHSREVWCLAGYSGVRRGKDRGRAIIFSRDSGTWENVPEPDGASVFHDVAFSDDGTTWISMSSDDDRALRILERRRPAKEWKAFSVAMPRYYSVVERLWQTPNGRELWLYASDCGLIRVERSHDAVSQYVHSEVRRFDGIPHFPLIDDYVEDLVFTLDSGTAICAASGGGPNGITTIDLSSGKSKNYRVPDSVTIPIERLILSPDNRTVWCIGNYSYLWAFDIEAESWTHECVITRDEMPTPYFDSLALSHDGEYVWIANNSGVACYSVAERQWIMLSDEEWYQACIFEEVSRSVIEISPDSRWVITGHARGVAIHEIDGSEYTVIETPGLKSTSRSCCSHILRIPGSDDFVVALEYDGGGGIYVFDGRTRRLHKRFALNQPITTMAFSDPESLWVAVVGTIYELDLATCSIEREHSFALDGERREADSQVEN